MIEFKTAEDLRAHYKAVSARLGVPQTRPIMYHVIPPEEPAKPAPKALPAIPELTALPPEPLVVELLPEMINEPTILGSKIHFSDVINLVMAYSGMRMSEIFARRRHKHIVHMRQLLWGLAYKHCTHLSLPAISKLSRSCANDTGFDHTTVLHGYRSALLFPEFNQLSEKLDQLRQKRTPV